MYNPVREEVFTARKNQGAYLNGERIHVTDTQGIDLILIAVDTCAFYMIDIVVRMRHLFKVSASKEMFDIVLALSLQYLLK